MRGVVTNGINKLIEEGADEKASEILSLLFELLSKSVAKELGDKRNLLTDYYKYLKSYIDCKILITKKKRAATFGYIDYSLEDIYSKATYYKQCKDAIKRDLESFGIQVQKSNYPCGFYNLLLKDIIPEHILNQ